MPQQLENVLSFNSDSCGDGASKTERNIDKSSSDNHHGPCDFETAVKATKFGKFNFLLFLLIIPAQWAAVFETTSMSYVFPAAQCDLDLSLTEKGTLNAVVFAGMVSSGLVWGFLCDILGRKKLLVIGELLDAMFVIVSSFSQNYPMLLISKFFGGFIINGPFAALTSYIAEFHSNQYRARVQLVRGFIVGSAGLALPALAWAVMPRHIEYKSAYLSLHSWNVYLMVCALPSLIAGLAFSFMPESPKYLMTHGNYDKALDVFRRVYAMNTGKPKDTYPVTELLVEAKVVNAATTTAAAAPVINKKLTTKQALAEGFVQLKTLFARPHLKNLTVVCGMQSLLMLCMNTLRLWFPQIFQSINDYSVKHNGTSSNLCSALDSLRETHDNTLPEECEVHLSGVVYANTMILASVAMIGYFVAGVLVQKFGKKTLLGLLLVFASACAFGLYFCQSVSAVLATASILLAFGNISGNIMLTIVMEMFPTTLRAVTLSFVLITARGASMIGNLVFPFLLTLGCGPSFFTIGTIIFASVFFLLFLPSTENKALG